MRQRNHVTPTQRTNARSSRKWCNPRC
jgi:hypothetical protein